MPLGTLRPRGFHTHSRATTTSSIGSQRDCMLLHGTAGAIPAFSSQGSKQAANMQFLVYLTVLMVSISTVLLEVHWLASPEPRPNPALQTRAVQAPKTEGSNAGVVYPKNPDESRPLESNSQVQTTDTRQATGRTTPVAQPLRHSGLRWRLSLISRNRLHLSAVRRWRATALRKICQAADSA